jgi:hypothetical protein
MKQSLVNVAPEGVYQLRREAFDCGKQLHNLDMVDPEKGCWDTTLVIVQRIP